MILDLLALWVIFGFVYLLAGAPKAKTTPEKYISVFLSGPIGWIVFVVLVVKYLVYEEL